jgi:2-oxoglutarate ferredoxin oxidoreductase subunit beta
MKEIIKEAILFKGTALVDILQPCVTFNKINTYQWLKERVFKIDKPIEDRYEAIKTAELWGDRIPIGVIYRNDAALCREIKKIFRERIREEDIENQLDLRCVMMR